MVESDSRRERAERFSAALRENAGYRWVGVYDVALDEVMLLAYAGDAPPAFPRFPVTAGLTSAAITDARPVLCNDVSHDSRYLTAFASTGSELIVPILDERGRTVGTIDVESERQNAFGPNDVEEVCAKAAALAPLFSPVTTRLARSTDAQAFAEIYAPFVEQTVVSFEAVAPSVEEMRDHVRRTLEMLPWLTATVADEVCGYAYASKHRERSAYRWAVDTSVYIHERFRGRGVGRKLYDALFPLLERQGFRRAYAGIALPNEASIALHRSTGFEPVGTYRRVGWKLGAWHDVAWLSRDIGPVDDPPVEPIPFSCIAEHR